MKFIHINQLKKTTQYVRKPGEYVYFFINYSGTLTINIQSKDSQVYIFGIYIGRNNDNFSLQTIQHHKSKGAVSDLLIKGVFFDASRFVYNGLIKIDKGAVHSNAYQKNQNIVLSDNVYIESRPNLEILSDDVKCTHGSTTGKLSEEHLLFLTMRGLTKIDAEKLLVTGFISDVFDTIAGLGGENESATFRAHAMKLLEQLYND